MIGGIIGHNFEDTLSPTLVYTSPVISEKIFEKFLRRRTPRDSENLCGLWVIELDKVRKPPLKTPTQIKSTLSGIILQ
jgi:hypothetical protein